MDEQIAAIWKYTPVVALLIVVGWAGYKGIWYWGGGVRAMVRQIETERDAWRDLAMALLKNSGIKNLPDRATATETAAQLLNGKAAQNE